MIVRVTCPSADCGAVGRVAGGSPGRCRKCGRSLEPAAFWGDTDSGDASAWKGPPSASAPDLPEQFGRYRIMGRLGQGGMGAVHLARDTKLDRVVALKVPFFRPDDGPRSIQRFDREARAAASLDHPNLCPIFDVGEIDGIHYLTMPFIKGKPLSEAMSRGRTLAEDQAAGVAHKLALALHEAHARGIVHRDLKPGNIMVNSRHELIIMDFGLARIAGDQDASLTLTGRILGTALYMAPEQAAGRAEAAGFASDVYSLGVILYELLTGVRPFEGPGSLVVALKNVKDPDPPSAHRFGLSPELDAICLKAIARRPEDRYASMSEFARELDAYLARKAAAAGSRGDSGGDSTGAALDRVVTEVLPGGVGRPDSTFVDEPRSALAGFGRTRPPGRGRVLAAFGAASLLSGIIIYLATDEGRIKIELNDPDAVLKIDGKEVSIEGLGEPITLRAGRHDYSVKWGDGEFTTDRFVVGRGADESLAVRFEARPRPAGVPSAGPRSTALRPAEIFAGSWSVDGDTLAETEQRVGSGKICEQGTAIAFGDAGWSSYDLTFKGMLTRGTHGIKVRFHYLSGDTYCEFALGSYGNTHSDLSCSYEGRWERSRENVRRDSIAGNHWYDVKIEVRGPEFRCFVDGAEVFHDRDDRFTRGRIGFSTWNSAASFREIRIKGVDGEILWEGPPAIEAPR